MKLKRDNERLISETFFTQLENAEKNMDLLKNVNKIIEIRTTTQIR